MEGQFLDQKDNPAQSAQYLPHRLSTAPTSRDFGGAT